MSTGRGVIYPKTQVEECRRLAVYGCKAPVGVNSFMIHDTEQRISLTTTPSVVRGNAGRRRWFVCPACARQVGVLYRPYKVGYFLCRHCHNLTYWLRQIHRDRWIETLARATKLHARMIQVLEGVGRKGFSKLERRQVQRISAKQNQFMRVLDEKKI